MRKGYGRPVLFFVCVIVGSVLVTGCAERKSEPDMEGT